MTLDNLYNLVSAWFSLAQRQMRLFTLEAKLAQYSILPFLGLLILFIIVCSTVCIFTLLTIGYCIYRFSNNMLMSLLIIETISIVGLIIITKWLYTYFKQLQFSRTRHYLKTKMQAEKNHAQN